MAGTASAESTSLINAERNDFSSLNAPPAAAAANSTQTHSAPIKLVLLLGTGARATLLTESSASIDQIKSDLCQDWPVVRCLVHLLSACHRLLNELGECRILESALRRRADCEYCTRASLLTMPRRCKVCVCVCEASGHALS